MKDKIELTRGWFDKGDSDLTALKSPCPPNSNSSPNTPRRAISPKPSANW